jgi:hypothetical protein
MASNTRQFRARKSAYDLARRAGTMMGSWAGNAGEEPIRVAEKIFEIYGG